VPQALVLRINRCQRCTTRGGNAVEQVLEIQRVDFDVTKIIPSGWNGTVPHKHADCAATARPGCAGTASGQAAAAPPNASIARSVTKADRQVV
jgi:hypothetical protein